MGTGHLVVTEVSGKGHLSWGQGRLSQGDRGDH